MVQNRLLVLSVFLSAVLLSACQARTVSYRGDKADPESVVSLSTLQAEKQHWQDYYVTVDYLAGRQGGRLQITGKLEFSTNSQVYNRRVHDMKLLLFLLDSELRVIDYRQIAEAPSTDLARQIAFNQDIPLTEAATAFTLGYDLVLVDEEMHVQMVHKGPQPGP